MKWPIALSASPPATPHEEGAVLRLRRGRTSPAEFFTGDSLNCRKETERRFLTSQILPPKRSSRRPRQELADYLLTPCVQPSLRRLSSTYSQSSAKFNCRFASRPICHVRAGSALPSIEDLDERSVGTPRAVPRLRRARGCWRSSRRGRLVHFCQCGLPIFVPILAGPASDARSPKEPPA